jgi:hypothetical protein
MPSVATALLDKRARRLHRVLFDALLLEGDVPALSVLADRLHTSPEVLRDAMRTLEAADYLAIDSDDQLTCLYPFSVAPTPHVVHVHGARRFAMCAVDALGIPAMLDQELDIDDRCAVCHVPIAVRARPGVIVSANPRQTLVVARREAAEPACAACCPFTVFVCGQEHADAFVRRVPGTLALSLAEALSHAEEIFGGLRDDVVPARRPRGQRWGTAYDA